MSSISRSKAVALAAEAVKISKSGFYFAPDGRRVDLSSAIKAARRNTRAYPPGAGEKIGGEDTLAVSCRAASSFSKTARIEVRNETTLQGAKRLVDEGLRPLALNFASAKNPGGGFKNGARAQEESLCRDSALFECLHGQPCYDFHRALGGAFYTDTALYSPDVPVFCAPSGALLPQPWLLSFVTCAAPNAGALPGDAATKAQILAGFEARIRLIARLGLEQEHDALVLGAWGCGAFGNDPRDIAPIFARVLKGEFDGAFQTVLFAVLDTSPEARIITPFETAFSTQADSSALLK